LAYYVGPSDIMMKPSDDDCNVTMLY